MGGVFLFAQPEKTLELYDLEVLEVTRGRGCYQCFTSLGTKVLVPFSGQKQKAEGLYELLKYMQECEIGMEVEQVMKTREEELLVEDEEKNRYILKDWIRGTEHAIFDSGMHWNEKESLEAVRVLARVHKCLEEYTRRAEDFSYEEAYAKKSRQLIKVKNFAKTRNTKNEFERIYLEQFAHFYEQATQAMEMVKNNPQTGCEKGICHGDFTHHNILCNENGLSIVRFEGFKEGWFVSDLVNYIRKILEKSRYDFQIARKLITAYGQERQLTEAERRMIYIQFLFPEKFFKLANHYDNSHKAWISARDIQKLKELVSKEPERTIFLTNLFSFVGE